MNRTADVAVYVEVLEEMLAEESKRVARLEAVLRAHECPVAAEPSEPE